jgi:hypothetical protein
MDHSSYWEPGNHTYHGVYGVNIQCAASPDVWRTPVRRGQSTHQHPHTQPQGVHGLSSRVMQSGSEPANGRRACRHDRRLRIHDAFGRRTPRGVLDLTLADIESYLQGKSGKHPLTSFKRFVRFLIDTGRIDYGTGENLYDFLKQVSKAN